MGKVCNFEQTTAVRLRYASPILGSKGFLPDQSLQKGNGGIPSNGATCSSSGALSRTVSFFRQILRLKIELLGQTLPKEVGCNMTDRVQFINHQGKQILLIDLSNCSPDNVDRIFRTAPDLVTARPLGSVLILSDLTGAFFDAEAIRVMQQTAVFDKPHIKKSAFVGTESFSQGFFENLRGFSRREFPAFKTRDEALACVVKD
jgi:hypothetical protein